ncbi:hypothetical protein C4D60_Mb09t26360 [Musa balbisiana]|uniref:Uncharacterized protein n=1 Tax=Musa balbisiana TaxID=52838 RepID=A0A4S8IJ77_MUSBA|nr:hypothetical protein C4D60_Mb09t26360 [Musa balbisiana]
MAVVRSLRGAITTRPYSFALVSTGTSAISEVGIDGCNELEDAYPRGFDLLLVNVLDLNEPEEEIFHTPEQVESRDCRLAGRQSGCDITPHRAYRQVDSRGPRYKNLKGLVEN